MQVVVTRRGRQGCQMIYFFTNFGKIWNKCFWCIVCTYICIICVKDVWYILPSLGDFLYFVPRKIWQPIVTDIIGFL
jgi:hypothetical protein